MDIKNAYLGHSKVSLIMIQRIRVSFKWDSTVLALECKANLLFCRKRLAYYEGTGHT